MLVQTPLNLMSYGTKDVKLGSHLPSEELLSSIASLHLTEHFTKVLHGVGSSYHDEPYEAFGLLPFGIPKYEQ
jgi:hypothetical protein